VSLWLKLEANSTALIVGMRSQFIRLGVPIQASIIAANARNFAAKSDKPSRHNGREGIEVRDMSNRNLAIGRLELDWLESIDTKLNRVRRGANWLIYASVVLGVALVAQLYALMVPSWLFYSIFAGWVLYLVAAIAVATGRDKAYPAALVLSIVTLAVSLPQPEHYSLAEAGLTFASLTFVAGSLLQVGVIILVTSFLILERRQERIRASPVRP
jgi:hypothetical protein